ncbi:hypothetical protein V22_25120 [Calycomorphotria hydatis]|uniref:Uncharacterized protein n=1 Tax=Calycomorphotria hydatis TaxID=2528027 RepID=A0A517TA67_9PLAN|nr:hypothetical protein V22_25120 [Calycomorphotria hydatis]
MGKAHQKDEKANGNGLRTVFLELLGGNRHDICRVGYLVCFEYAQSSACLGFRIGN